MTIQAENTSVVPPQTSLLRDLYELGKPRLTFWVLITVSTGYVMSYAPGTFSWLLLLITVSGVALCSAGAAAVNMFIERGDDAHMDRTKNRPLPSGRMTSGQVLLFGALTSFAGLALLYVKVNELSALLAFASAVSYILLYTPLKKRTSLNTLVGAVTGALPPLIGFSAATGTVPLTAWSLFAILYVWQLPHFLAIAWLYRDDYAKAGMQMLSVEDPSGRLTMQQILLFSLLMIPVSITPTMVGLTGNLYLWTALVLGTFFFVGSLVLSRSKTKLLARNLFWLSLIYLPLLLGVMMADRI